jgi:hypothetical protein
MNSAEVNPAKAVDIIKSLENSISTLKWDFYVGDIYSANNREVLDSVSVLVDIQTKRYYIDRKIVSKKRKSIFSFNGREYVSFSGMLEGEKTATSLLDLGKISTEANDMPSSETLKNNWSIVGIGNGVPGLFAPFFADDDVPTFFSLFMKRWIKGKKVISVSDNRQGVMDIKIFTKFFDIPYVMYISYDITKKGIITYVKASPVKDKTHAEQLTFGEGKVFFEMSVLTKKNDQGQDVPETIKFHQPDSKINNTLTYANFIINPPIDSKSFVIDFPDGTYVDDQIQKMYYKIGDLIDEDKAISDFMLLHNLTGDVPRPQHRYGIAFRYILIGTGIVLIVIAIYLRFFRKRDK